MERNDDYANGDRRELEVLGMSEFSYPHPDPNADPSSMLREPSRIRLYEYSSLENHWYESGGDVLTDFLEPPIVSEEENGRFEVKFSYKVDGNHADKIDYFRILICPVPIYWEEMFYIHEIERGLNAIHVVAKHITFLADKTPMHKWERLNATGNDAATAATAALKSNPQNINLSSRWGATDARYDLSVEENTTLGDFISDTWLALYGGQIWRRWRDVRLWQRRGGDTQVQIAKYKNLLDRSWTGNIDHVVTRAHVRANIQKDWLLPKVTGAPLTDRFVKAGQAGKLHVSVRDKSTRQLLNGRMKFAIYDANGNKLETYETHDDDSIKKQTEDLERWTKDLEKKRATLPETGGEKYIRITLSKTINIYMTGANAAAKTNRAGSVPKGTYYVWGWRTSGYEGNPNVFAISDTPGASMARGWVNLTEDDKAKKDGKWAANQVTKLDGVIQELEDKIAAVDVGLFGRRVFTSAVPGTYTIIMESAPDGYVEDYWPRQKIVVNTAEETLVHFYLDSEEVEGATSALFLDKTLDSPLIHDYPIVMDGFFEVSDPAIVTQKALDAYTESLYTQENIDLILEDFTVTPDDLVTLETFNIGSTALVYLEDRDVDRRVPCVAYEYDALRQEIVSYTFGKKREGLGGVLGKRLRKWMDAQTKETIHRTENVARAASRKTMAVANDLQGQVYALNGELDFRMRSLLADTVETNALFAAYAEIDEAVIEKASITELTAVDAKIESLRAIAVTTEYLFANYLEANEIRTQFASVGTLNAVTARVDTLEADSITTEYLFANYLSAAEIQANYLTTTELDANYATIGDLNAANATIGNLVTREAEISTLLAGNLTADNMQANFITADSGLIDVGAITTAMIQDAAITSAQLAEASITDAHIVELTANKITAGTLSVDRLEIRGSENSIVYQLNNITGALQAQNVDTLNGEIVTPRSITADKIVAKSITGEEIKARSITANELVSGTITAESGVIASLDANKITAGTLDVARIGSQSITVDKLAANVGQSLNLESNVSITTAVSNQLTPINESITNISESMTEIEQTHERITARITQTEDDLDKQGEDLTGLRKDVDTYFTFAADGLTVGKTDSLKQIVLSNEQLAFKDNGQIVANIEGRVMNIDDVFVRYGLIVGVHKIEKYNENVTLIRYVGSWS